MRDHTGDIVARDLHLHGTDGDLEAVIVEVAQNPTIAAERTQPHGVADGHLFDDVLLGVRIALVRAGAVRDDGGVELLAKFPAHFGDTAFGVLR